MSFFDDVPSKGRDEGFIAAHPSAPVWHHAHPQHHHQDPIKTTISAMTTMTMSAPAPLISFDREAFSQPLTFLAPSAVPVTPVACHICQKNFTMLPPVRSYRCTCCGLLVCHACSNRTMHPIFPAAAAAASNAVAFEPSKSSSAVRTCRNCEGHFAQGQSVCLRRLLNILATEGCPLDTAAGGLPGRQLLALVGLAEAAEFAAACGMRFKAVAQEWEGDKQAILANGNYTSSATGRKITIPADLLERTRLDGQEASEFLRTVDENGGVVTLLNLISTVFGFQVPALGVSEMRDSDDDEAVAGGAGVVSGAAGWEEAMLFFASSQRLTVDEKWCFPCAPGAFFKNKGSLSHLPCRKPCCAYSWSRQQRTEAAQATAVPVPGASRVTVRPRGGSADSANGSGSGAALPLLPEAVSGRSSRANSMDSNDPRAAAQKAQFESIKASIEAEDTVPRLRTTIHDLLAAELTSTASCKAREKPATKMAPGISSSWNPSPPPPSLPSVGGSGSPYPPSAAAVVGAGSGFPSVSPGLWPWTAAAREATNAALPFPGATLPPAGPDKGKGGNAAAQASSWPLPLEAAPRLRLPKAAFESSLLKNPHATVLVAHLAACRVLCALSEICLCSTALVRENSPAEKRWSPLSFFAVAVGTGGVDGLPPPLLSTPGLSSFPGFDLGKALAKMLQQYNASGVVQEALQQWQYALLVPDSPRRPAFSSSSVSMEAAARLTQVQAAKVTVASRLSYWLHVSRALASLLNFKDDYQQYHASSTANAALLQGSSLDGTGRERSSSAGLYPALASQSHSSPLTGPASLSSSPFAPPSLSLGPGVAQATAVSRQASGMGQLAAGTERDLQALTCRLQHSLLKSQGLTLLTSMLVEAQQFADIASNQALQAANATAAGDANGKKKLSGWANYGLCEQEQEGGNREEGALIADCYHFLPSIFLLLLAKIQPQPSLETVKDEKSIKAVATRSAKAYDATLLQVVKEQLMGLGLSLTTTGPGSSATEGDSDGLVKAQALGQITTKAAGRLEALLAATLAGGQEAGPKGSCVLTTMQEAALQSASHSFVRAFAAVSSLVDCLQAVAVSSTPSSGSAAVAASSPPGPAFFALQAAALKELLTVKRHSSSTPSGSYRSGLALSPAEADPLALVLTIVCDSDTRRLFERASASSASSSGSSSLVQGLYCEGLSLLRLALSLPASTAAGANGTETADTLEQALQWPFWVHLCRLLALLVDEDPSSGLSPSPAVILQIIDTLQCAVSSAAAAAGTSRKKGGGAKGSSSGRTTRDSNSSNPFDEDVDEDKDSSNKEEERSFPASDFSFCLLAGGLLPSLSKLIAKTILSPQDPAAAFKKRQDLAEETSDDHQLLLTSAKLAHSLLICAQWGLDRDGVLGNSMPFTLALRLACTKSAGTSKQDTKESGHKDDEPSTDTNEIESTLLYEWVSLGRSALAAAVEFALAAADQQALQYQLAGGVAPPLPPPSSTHGSAPWSSCVKILSISAAFYQGSSSALQALQDALKTASSAASGTDSSQQQEELLDLADEGLAISTNLFLNDAEASGVGFSLRWLSERRTLLSLLGIETSEDTEPLDDRFLIHRSGCKHHSPQQQATTISVAPFTCSCRELRIRQAAKSAFVGMSNWIELCFGKGGETGVIDRFLDKRGGASSMTAIHSLVDIALSSSRPVAPLSPFALSASRCLAALIRQTAAHKASALLQLLQGLTKESIKNGSTLTRLASWSAAGIFRQDKKRDNAKENVPADDQEEAERLTVELLLQSVTALLRDKETKEKPEAPLLAADVMQGLVAAMKESSKIPCDKQRICAVAWLLLRLEEALAIPAGSSSFSFPSFPTSSLPSMLHQALVSCILAEAQGREDSVPLATITLLAGSQGGQRADVLLGSLLDAPFTTLYRPYYSRQSCFAAASEALQVLRLRPLSARGDAEGKAALASLARRSVRPLVLAGKEAFLKTEKGKAISEGQEAFALECCDALLGLGEGRIGLIREAMVACSGDEVAPAPAPDAAAPTDDLLAVLLFLFCRHPTLKEEGSEEGEGDGQDQDQDQDLTLPAQILGLATALLCPTSATAADALIEPDGTPSEDKEGKRPLFSWESLANASRKRFPSLFAEVMQSLCSLLSAAELVSDGFALKTCYTALSSLGSALASSSSVKNAVLSGEASADVLATILLRQSHTSANFTLPVLRALVPSSCFGRSRALWSQGGNTTTAPPASVADRLKALRVPGAGHFDQRPLLSSQHSTITTSLDCDGRCISSGSEEEDKTRLQALRATVAKALFAENLTSEEETGAHMDIKLKQFCSLLLQKQDDSRSHAGDVEIALLLLFVALEESAEKVVAQLDGKELLGGLALFCLGKNEGLSFSTAALAELMLVRVAEVDVSANTMTRPEKGPYKPSNEKKREKADALADLCCGAVLDAASTTGSSSMRALFSKAIEGDLPEELVSSRPAEERKEADTDVTDALIFICGKQREFCLPSPSSENAKVTAGECAACASRVLLRALAALEQRPHRGVAVGLLAFSLTQACIDIDTDRSAAASREEQLLVASSLLAAAFPLLVGVGRIGSGSELEGGYAEVGAFPSLLLRVIPFALNAASTFACDAAKRQAPASIPPPLLPPANATINRTTSAPPGALSVLPAAPELPAASLSIFKPKLAPSSSSNNVGSSGGGSALQDRLRAALGPAPSASSSSFSGGDQSSPLALALGSPASITPTRRRSSTAVSSGAAAIAAMAPPVPPPAKRDESGKPRASIGGTAALKLHSYEQQQQQQLIESMLSCALQSAILASDVGASRSAAGCEAVRHCVAHLKKSASSFPDQKEQQHEHSCLDAAALFIAFLFVSLPCKQRAEETGEGEGGPGSEMALLLRELSSAMPSSSSSVPLQLLKAASLTQILSLDL